MAEEEIGSKEQALKSNRILFCYFFIVLLLGLVAIGILVRAFDTACGKGDLDEGGREPEASEPPDLSQPWKYLFFRRQADGDQYANISHISISTPDCYTHRASGTAWIR